MKEIAEAGAILGEEGPEKHLSFTTQTQMCDEDPFS